MQIVEAPVRVFNQESVDDFEGYGPVSSSNNFINITVDGVFDPLFKLVEHLECFNVH